MAQVVGCSALSCWELEQATWFLVAGSNRIPASRHTAASATKTLPNTKLEVSAKLKLSQLATLRRKYSSLIRPFAKMKFLKGMIFSQLLLADTCMRALSSVWVIDMNWIAARFLVETLFIDLTLCENGISEEEGSLAVVMLGTCMCVLCSVQVFDVNWCRKAHSIGKTGETMN